MASDIQSNKTKRFRCLNAENAFRLLAKLNQIGPFCGQNAVNFLERNSKIGTSGFEWRYRREWADTLRYSEMERATVSQGGGPSP